MAKRFTTLLDPDVIRDPYPILAELRKTSPVVWDPLALQELDCMLEGALEFLPEGARLVDDELEWESIGLMRRPVNLPVDFG